MGRTPGTRAQSPKRRPDSIEGQGVKPPKNAEEKEKEGAFSAWKDWELRQTRGHSLFWFLGQWPSEEQDMGLCGAKQAVRSGPRSATRSPAGLTWLMDHVVDPALALLHPQVPPLRLRQQVGLGHQLGDVLGQHHVPAPPHLSVNTRAPPTTPHSPTGKMLTGPAP